MDLLEFARGPALQVAAYVLVAGTIWRIVGVLLLKGKPEFSEPRARGGLPAQGHLDSFVHSSAVQAGDTVPGVDGVRPAHRFVHNDLLVHAAYRVLRRLDRV